MHFRIRDEYLWGPRATPKSLILASIFLLFMMLGVREIWTQEHRWADVVDYMLYYHDYLHPVLNGNEYYDKPLLSYWIIAGISLLTGELSTWTLRLPSAFMGVLSVTSIYLIGRQLKDRRLGLLAGWMLLTTFYFIFWARVASTDMLNLGGTLCALAWYFLKREQPSLINYGIFYSIVAITALFKGLLAPVVVLIAIAMDVVLQNTWKKYFMDWRFYLAPVPAILIYLLPFWISNHFGAAVYKSDGLALVYRENILRYFHPFDHQDPIYIYFYYLPLYLMPWTFFFVPALGHLKSRWRSLSHSSLWMIAVTMFLFLFFTFSGSRRGYYILPVVPFAILMTADWILAQSGRAYCYAGRMIMVFYILFVIHNLVLLPWFYKTGGVKTFQGVLNNEVSKVHPWADWNFSLLDAQTKLTFYLRLRPNVINYGIVGLREDQTLATVLKTWPTIRTLPKNTIFVTRRSYVPILAGIFKDYTLVEAAPTYLERLLSKKDPEAPVAYVPKNFML